MLLTQVLLDSVSWLDSTLIAAHVKNVVAEKALIPQSNPWKDYGIPALATFTALAGTLLAFFLARMAIVVSKYNYYVNLQNYVDIYFQEFDIKKTDARKYHYNNILYLSDILRKKDKSNHKVSFKKVEYDTGRILNINQSDSYSVFVNLKQCDEIDKVKLHKAYNSILYNMKVLQDGSDEYQKWLIDNKSLGNVGDIIKDNVALLSKELLNFRISEDIPEPFFNNIIGIIHNYSAEVNAPQSQIYKIHYDYALAINNFCVFNYIDLNPVHNMDNTILLCNKIMNM